MDWEYLSILTRNRQEEVIIMNRKKIIILFHLLFILFFLNGCFITFYPAKIVNKGEQVIGLGVAAEKTSQSLSLFGINPCNSFFIRYGILNNYDIGISIKNIYLIPLVTASVRKQFDFDNRIINALTVDLGCGGGGNYELIGFINSSIINNDFAVTFGFGAIQIFPIFSINTYNFTTRISYEIKMGKVNIMPFLCYESSQDFDKGSILTLISPEEYLIDEEKWQTKKFGIGVSFYFNINL